MKWNKEILLQSGIVIICFFTISYYLLNSFILSGILVIIALFLISIVNRYRLSWIQKKQSLEAANQFVRLMNVVLYSSSQLYENYKKIESYLPIEWVNLPEESFTDSLQEVAQNYSLRIFDLYIQSLIHFNQENWDKNNILIIASMIQKNKLYQDELSKKKTKKISETIFLVVVWLFLMVFIRYALADFYFQFLQEKYGRIVIFFMLVTGMINCFWGFKEFFTFQKSEE